MKYIVFNVITSFLLFGSCQSNKLENDVLNICINDICFSLLNVDTGYMKINESQLYLNDFYGTLNNGDNSCQTANQVVWMYSGKSIDSCEYIGLNYINDTLVCMQINFIEDDNTHPSAVINDTFLAPLDKFDSEYLSKAFRNYTFTEETILSNKIKYKVINICANKYKDYNCWLLPFCF